ncbi:GntR family transcriptional regulator [Salinisphaera sp.]|uniref:GntR family transcriptional regulator n=1 Tax=Salinisphaera sp. TaxID=1914330 RepID=UPI002D789D52|nr:GntR family transcriptional regulator [Salinisphaera sp.]HET7313960.1 GntR family transcriptional regulator [Salinisphaera sp.]
MASSTVSVDDMEIAPVELDGAGITRQEWVYLQLKEAVLTGQFVPGRSVTLRGIAQMLGTSPTPVREALRRLVAERALESHGNRRVSVPRMTPAKLSDLCAVRANLEAFAAERAMPLIDDAHLDRLWELDAKVDTAIEAGEIRTYLQRHRAFHFTLYDVGDASAIMPLIESVWLQFSPFLRLAIHHIGSEYIVDRHVEALRAIAARDAQALRFAIEADVREGLGSLTEADWRNLEAAG